MSNTSLSTKNLGIQFGGHKAVDGVTVSFTPGELSVIVGPNGAGKTTWFNLISGQLRPTTGKIFLGEDEITNLSPSARANKGVGRAFQLTSLFPKLSVFENVRLGVQARRKQGARLFVRAAQLSDLADEAMSYLEMARLTHLSDFPAASLPHGDQRKLEVALLLAMEPKIFMFDEPTAGMAIDEAPAILDLIAQIKKDTSRTVLLVEHKMDVVRTLADRVIVLHNGQLIADGEPAEVMSRDIVREIYLGADVEDIA